MEDIVSEAGFQSGDFLQSRKTDVVDVDDVREILGMYLSELQGNRQKSSKIKIERIESSLTPSGLKKVGDARKSMRMQHEAVMRTRQRFAPLPPVVREPSTENYGFDDGPSAFISRMHSWGNHPEDDRRYYLHMVFRYYFKEYHDHAVLSDMVIEYPTYQFVLDTLEPNGCANKFPPEFRRFLVDSSGRTITTATLPVPVKGSATSITYKNNFEANPHVSLLRRKIQAIVVDWKRRGKGYSVYPSYLRTGDPRNGYIQERVSHAHEVGVVRKGVSKLEGVVPSKMEDLVGKAPESTLAYDRYMSYTFSTRGEQLRERMGFFARGSYRNIFFAIYASGLVEDLFHASGAGMDTFVSFENFCTKGRPIANLLKEEDMSRSLLMVLVEVCFLIGAYDKRTMCEEDETKIIVNAVHAMSSGEAGKK